MVTISPFVGETTQVIQFTKELEDNIFNPFRWAIPEGACVYLAWDNGKIGGAGYLNIGKKFESRYTAELACAVLPNWRKMGIASKLMEYMIAEAKKRELRKIWLRCYEHNNPAIALYVKFGFVIEGVFKSQEWTELDEPLNLLAMALFL